MYREGHCGGGFYVLTVQLMSEDGEVKYHTMSLNYRVKCTFECPLTH